MSELKVTTERTPGQLVVRALKFLGFALGIEIIFFVVLWLQTPTAGASANAIQYLFAADPAKMTWYITRAAGFTSYLLLWFSTAWGLGVASKIFDALLHRSFTFDFHEFISLLTIGFLGLHMFILMFDSYMPYNLAQIFVPFLSPYRPVWIGLGVIGMYLILLVTITFYIKNRIGMKAFRAIHGLSLLGYLGATLHGVFSGTDSSLPAVQYLYVGSFLVVVFLTAYWLFTRQPKRIPAAAQAQRNIPAANIGRGA
jgi:predicted ferric reductase